MVNVDNKLVAMLKNMYPTGTRVRLHYMDDARAVEPGEEGTVRLVDDMGTIHVDWDNGRRLGLIYGEDGFEII
jgi:hypothetical protein